MSFGLKNAGATYQRAMVALFYDMMHKEIEVYVDDMIAKSKNEEQHLVNLWKLFKRLCKYQLRLNPAKCTFGVKLGKLLDFIVSQKRIEVDPDKAKAILKMPEPRTEKQLLRKNQSVQWDDDCQVAFGRIKPCLMNPLVLVPPVLERPLILYMTVLDESMGSHHLRQYMLNYTTWLVSKMDPVKYIFEKPALTGRIARWQVLLLEFDIVYVPQKEIKENALTDYLAQQPINDYQPMHPKFPDEDIITLFKEEVEDEDRDKWIVWFDGASNALGHGVGAVLVTPDDQCIPFMARLGFDCTNNMAEYEACALGIQATIDFKVKLLKVYGDSALVIYQLRGEWETRDHKLIPYQAYIKKLTKFFDDISFHHIPREENQMVDALAILASMFQLTPHEDLSYIKFRCPDKEYPREASNNDKRTLRRLAASFFLSGNILYKRNHDMVFLRCVDAKEAKQMLVEVHEGSFGTHANGHAMAQKILRVGYYWLTMENDCCIHVRKCHKCQAFIDNVNALPIPLNVLAAPWPFSMWGIDVIGAIEPKVSNGHRFISVAIDYFTKWVEVASYASVTRSVVVYGMEDVLPFEVEIPALRILAESGLEESE
ncbi:uncharacterized protein LOC114389868 [Glycine soja]|uniref:uncharacterized protein LOC114389868 n=1 Tax=Glycine soja TaxID=3848 RepID=UPI00103AD3B2|nr:uncharacterized protein LOC114389868 [Glycine soja]